MTPIQTLRTRLKQAHAGATGALTDAIQERLEHELEVIQTSGYASLFLIVEEIISFCAPDRCAVQLARLRRADRWWRTVWELPLPIRCGWIYISSVFSTRRAIHRRYRYRSVFQTP